MLLLRFVALPEAYRAVVGTHSVGPGASHLERRCKLWLHFAQANLHLRLSVRPPSVPAMTMMPASVSIKRVMCVSSSDSKASWNIDQVTMIDGEEFVKLVKNDRGFRKWICDTIHDKREYYQMTFLQELGKLRTEATMKDCINAQSTGLFDDPAPTQKAAKRAKLAFRRRGDEMPSMIELELPAFVAASGCAVPSTKMKVAADLKANANVVVELSTSALSYVKEAMRNSIAGAQNREHRTGDGVHWRAERSSWRAARKDDGQRKYRQFKVKDPESSVSIEAARTIAKRWALGEDIESDKENEPIAGAEDLPIQDDGCDGGLCAAVA